MLFFSILTFALLFTELEGRKGGGGGSKGSSSSRPSGSCSSKPSSSSSKPSSWFSSSSSSKPSRPTTSSGNKYKYNPVSNKMKTSGWSKNVKTAAGAYLALKTAKKLKRKPKLWTGYGFEYCDPNDIFQDEDCINPYSDYSQIQSCFSCESYNGNNPNCERADGSVSINLLNQQSCNSALSYCGIVIGGYGDSDDNSFFQRGCFAKNLFEDLKCNIPNDIEVSWSITDGFEVDKVNTYCDYCDSNNCNGWTLRALPDEQFYDPDTASSLSLAFFLLTAILLM